MNNQDTSVVPNCALDLTDEAILEIMIRTLPIHLEDVSDMRKLINKLWPVLVDEFKINTSKQ